MGFISAALQTTGVVAGLMYFAGRKGLRRVARMSGAVIGQSIANMRRSRGEVHKKFTETETEEQRKAAIEMQKGWWEVRMIMNEFAMLRSFNPRLLQAGNFGFTDEEMMAALGRQPVGFEESEAARMNHIERQLDMERQQMENPSMFPVAGRHGSGNDVDAFQAASAAGLTPARPGEDILSMHTQQSAAAGHTSSSQTTSQFAAQQPADTVQVTTADGRIEYRPIATRAVSPLESQLAADGSPMADMVRDPEVQRMLRDMSAKQGDGGSDSSGNSNSR